MLCIVLTIFMNVEKFLVNDTDITNAQALSKTYVLQLKLRVLFRLEENIFPIYMTSCN
jgi:hypothetical protein